MRRKDKEITDKSVINEILEKSQICRIAINDGDFPYIIPFNYGYRNDCIYFHSAKEGRKIELLRKNNKVSFEIEFMSEVIKHEQSCKWTSKYRSIMGTGTIEIITDFEEKKKGLDAIMQHYGKMDNSYNEQHVNNILILKLSIISISGKQSGDWS
jgi:nitroimidazol reductase NimA-like FMN-containing flavoprotein (pyridoxamine 5'-phosphate oxidase superfamily)